MKIDCLSFHEHLSAWMDGELDVEVSLLMQQHLAACELCSHEWKHFQRVDLLTGSLEVSSKCLPAWELIEEKMSELQSGQNGKRSERVSDEKQRLYPRSRSWKASLGMLLALTASVIAMVSLGRFNRINRPSSQPIQNELATKNRLHLQSVVESFENNPQASLNVLREQYELQELSLADVESNFGRATFVSAVLKDGSLPGSAEPEEIRWLSLPNCHCPKGQCACGENGCNCIVSICQRPDGSIYLVFEQCSPQDVDFGELSVELVKRNGFEFQQIRAGSTRAVSFDWASGKVVVIGLRSDSEVELLFANN